MSKAPIVSTVMLYCPLCLEPLGAPLRLKFISVLSGEMLRVAFDDAVVEHLCKGPLA